MKAEFENKLNNLGFSYRSNLNNLYILNSINDSEGRIKVRLIYSKPADERKYDSKNGNVIESIGLFKFKFNPGMSESDFITFAFQNSIKHQIEFIIIPTDELNQRLTKEDRMRNGNNSHKIVFWLMTDGFIYNCTDIGIEGEWYFMSKGEFGRMADNTKWDFTEFLNAWDRLKRI